MSLDEFIKKWNIPAELVDDLRLIDVFEFICQNYEPEDGLTMLADYYNYGQEIQNDIEDSVRNGLIKTLNSYYE